MENEHSRKLIKTRETLRDGTPAELSAGSHATLANAPAHPRLLPYVPPSPTFSLRARTSPPPSCDWASTNSIAGGQALPRRPPWLPAAMAGCTPRILVLQPSPRTASTAVEKSFNHRQKSFNGTAQQGEAATAVGFCYYWRSFLLHPSGGAATSRR